MDFQFQVNDIVDVNGVKGIVRFYGPTEFMPGTDWVGVELESPTGKNNGTVQGVQYFTCREKYGMFVKPSMPRLIERPVGGGGGGRKQPQQPQSPAQRKPSGREPVRPPSSARGAISTPPLPSGTSTPRTQTPVTRGHVSTPSLSGISGVRSRPGSMGPPARAPTATKPTPSVTTTAAPAATPPSRSSTAASNTSGSTTPVSTSASRVNRVSLKPGQVAGLQRKASAESSASQRSSPDGLVGRQRGDTITSQSAALARDAAREQREQREQRPVMKRRESLSPGDAVVMGKPRQGSISQGELTALNRENEDLKSKIKVLERKRQEDRENLKKMQRLEEERNKFEAIIQKLQQKYQPIQAEVLELREKNKEMEKITREAEEQRDDMEASYEMATLDREMAEQESEAYKAELEIVRGRMEELEVEIEILREENEELSQGMSPEEKTSAGWLQLEKQNERLKDALLRLREITSTAEEELKADKASLEEEVQELQKYKEDYENMESDLIQNKKGVEELRAQLEAALGAEEMVEELTEQNMNLREQIDEYRAMIEDLESLKEISDELEINHIETEKQMQEDLDYRDLILLEQAKKISALDASNEEAEYTITRFRDLVMNLQSDLEDMKASKQLTETEATDLTARSRSIFDINMKLQITAAKAQNKTIDLELRKLEAEEAIEHLNIVQMFLPDSFHEDRDSVSALLRFKRVAFKAGMLQTFVKERLAQVDKFDHGNELQLMAACEMCDKLTWVSAMCDRFVTCISSCSVEQFSRFQGALYELDPVERALNGWIEGLRRDELNERNCVSELQRTMALMSHLGEIHLKNDLEGFASDMHMRVLMMQTHMESTAAAVSLIKLAIQKKLPTTPEDEETASSFAKKSDAIISQSRNIKVVVSKILRSLDDFRLRNLSIATDKKTAFEECEAAAQKLATYMRAVGDDVYNLLFHAADAPEPTWPDLLETMFRTTEQVLSMSESDIFNAVSKDLRNLGAALSDLAAVATDIDMTAEFEKAPPPWQVRALDLKSTKVVNIDIEEELRRLKYDIRESATQIRLRDLALEESAVKIELLESRMRNVTKQSERIEELEKLLQEGGQREKDFSKAIEELNEEVQALETEVGKWRKAAEDKRAVGETDRAGQERAVATAREVESLKKEIMNLKGAVEFFREEAAAIRRRDLTAPDSWLLEPLLETPEMLVRKYEAQLAKEARDVMGELRSLVLEEKVVKISRSKKDMRWRPVKESPKWTCARQKERYEAVKGWKEDLLGRVQAHTGGQEKKKAGEVGKVKLRLPEGWTKLQGELDRVVVHEPESWEELRGQLGVMDV